MPKGPILFLKTIIVLIGLLVLGICVFGLPQLIMSEWTGDFDYGWIFVGLYVPAVPFFVALYQALKLLGYIEQNNAFSEPSVQALNRIKYCGYIISALFAVGMPYIFRLAELDDAPGVAMLGFVIIGVSFVVSTFAAVLQTLVQTAVEMKSENDLTV